MEQLDSLYQLVTEVTNAQYQPTYATLSVPILKRMILTAALQGKYMVVYQYPESVAQAMVIEQQGQVPDFSPRVLLEYKKATQDIVDTFEGSKFVITSVQGTNGFKVSWSGATPPPKPVEQSQTSENTDVDVDTSADNIEEEKEEVLI